MTEDERYEMLFYVLYNYKQIMEYREISVFAMLVGLVVVMGLYDEYVEYEKRRRGDEQVIPSEI